MIVCICLVLDATGYMKEENVALREKRDNVRAIGDIINTHGAVLDREKTYRLDVVSGSLIIQEEE